MPAVAFTFRDGERVIRFAPEALAEATSLIDAQGLGGYALLTTERALARAPSALRHGAAVVLDVPHGSVPEAAAAVRTRAGARPLVALGGGRVVDAAKAIAAAEGLRCAAIPTTLAGSSFTPFHRMPAGIEGYGFLRPALAVCDPALMGSAPMPGLAASAMNALAHAVESLYAPGANPVTEGAALRAAALIAEALSEAPPRAEGLALGAVLGGWAVGSAGLAIHHALCQTIVRTAGTPHAETNAVMLPHSVAFMAGRATTEIGRLARALGAAGGDASAAVAKLAALAGVRTLSELGMAERDVERVTAAALDHPAVARTLGGVAEAEIRELLRAAL